MDLLNHLDRETSLAISLRGDELAWILASVSLSINVVPESPVAFRAHRKLINHRKAWLERVRLTPAPEPATQP